MIVAALGSMTYPLDMILYGEITTMFTDRIDYPERMTTETFLLPFFGGGTVLYVASINGCNMFYSFVFRVCSWFFFLFLKEQMERLMKIAKRWWTIRWHSEYLWLWMLSSKLFPAQYQWIWWIMQGSSRWISWIPNVFYWMLEWCIGLFTD